MRRQRDTVHKSIPGKSLPRPDPAEAAAPQDDATFRRRYRTALLAVTLVLFVVICLLSTRPLTWPSSHYNDMAILMAGENFARYGFIARHLLPVYFIGDISDQAGYYTYYSHTAPLCHLFNGLLQTLGIHSLVVMRLICGSLFIVGMLCMTSAFKRAIGSLAAVCGLAFVGTTGWFILYCTGLYDTLNFFFLGLFFLFFMRAVHGEGPVRRLWLVCWLLLLLASMNSYEFIVYAQVFAWAYAWAVGRLRATWRGLVALATAPVTSVGLHFLQVIWALGWAEAWADRLGIGYVRGGASGLATRWQYMKLVPTFLITHSQRLFFWPFHAVVLAGAVCLFVTSRRQANNPASRPGPLLLSLLLASPTWFVAMPYAAVRNDYTIQQLVPLMLAVMGMVSAVVARGLFGRGTPSLERAIALLAGTLLVFGQCSSLWNNAAGQVDELAPIAEAIGPDALPPRVGVLFNAPSVQFAYYLRRPLWKVPNMEPVPPVPFPDSLPVLQKHLPPDWPIRYYLYASWGDPGPFELLTSTCPGRMHVFSPRVGVILFDISALHLPPEKRAPLDPGLKARQLQGQFPTWEIPGIQERMSRLSGRLSGK